RDLLDPRIDRLPEPLPRPRLALQRPPHQGLEDPVRQRGPRNVMTTHRHTSSFLSRPRVGMDEGPRPAYRAPSEGPRGPAPSSGSLPLMETVAIPSGCDHQSNFPTQKGGGRLRERSLLYVLCPAGCPSTPVGCERSPVGCERSPVGCERSPVGCER